MVTSFLIQKKSDKKSVQLSIFSLLSLVPTKVFLLSKTLQITLSYPHTRVLTFNIYI